MAFPITKTFKIPFQGGAAIIVALVKVNLLGEDSVLSKVTQYNEDGTTKQWDTSGDITMDISWLDGVMTVNINESPNNIINDCRCCIIPGNPFA